MRAAGVDNVEPQPSEEPQRLFVVPEELEFFQRFLQSDGRILVSRNRGLARIAQHGFELQQDQENHRTCDSKYLPLSLLKLILV